MLQPIAVGLIVAAAAGYVVWTLLPNSVRSRLSGRVPVASGCGASCTGCPSSGGRGSGSAGPPASPPGTSEAQCTPTPGSAPQALRGGQEMHVRFFPVRLASYKASSARSNASSSASPGR